ncbi:immunity protein Tsi6 family protein [Pantoea stewartii]|uniref:immunity protein Tsi6 family protein n=1 Tax=Pantoea stewartii TaxID=66269 RepID=UPI00138FB574|nr:immunity protein Tsi6 family protein [Pantoea stewartii]
MNINDYTAIDYINDAIKVTSKRLAEKPQFSLYQMALEQLYYLKKTITGEEKDKSPIHRMNLGALASKEFDTTDPELAKHLSNANYIASQIGRGLKIILPHETDPEYEKRMKRYAYVKK